MIEDVYSLIKKFLISLFIFTAPNTIKNVNLKSISNIDNQYIYIWSLFNALKLSLQNSKVEYFLKVNFFNGFEIAWPRSKFWYIAFKHLVYLKNLISVMLVRRVYPSPCGRLSLCDKKSYWVLEKKCLFIKEINNDKNLVGVKRNVRVMI